MGIWEIVYIAWMMLAVGISLAKHGEPRDGEYSFWSSLIGCVIQVFILYKGGFFS